MITNHQDQPKRIPKIHKSVRIKSPDSVKSPPPIKDPETRMSILRRVSRRVSVAFGLRHSLTPPPSGTLKLWKEAHHAVDNENAHIRSSLEEWALMTGWHGVVDFFFAKSLSSKALWAAVVGLCAFLALNETISFLMDYTEGEKWMTSISYKTGDDMTVQWPNITISNLNWLGQSSLDKAGVTDPYLVTYIIDADADAVRFCERFIDNTSVPIEQILNRTEKKYSRYLLEHNTTRTKVRSFFFALTLLFVVVTKHE